ncbi:PREDICTED: uncharacterized protein LOC109584196 [Amphimedon queenslandica]|uniref:Death domain-containing protein n=1 Tax=Amphimedon queenslandica TaxID=400682 RepID=A0AAN0JEG0_AMPQE|nr:PREDICTED: uncharacterized protein LOC109584196 [Amphimedon queenslandica]|eukprot:XP_019855405.1 PREDICTED: uncharacterized protein LOC109584196 [Amphimedon queenslandica]
MPALLPLIDISDTEVATLKTTPLLFYFKDRAVPMGLFCAVIVHLLSDSWRITSRQGNYSNFFTLQKTMEGCQIINLTLVEQLDCIEIHCGKTADRVKVKDAVEKSIKDVMEKKNIDDELPILAFYCSCGDARDHKATIKNSTIKEDFIIVNCEKFDDDIEEKSTENCSWLTSKRDIKDEFTKILHIGDLKEIITILQEKEFPFDKWFDFGLRLDVTYNQLQVIKNDMRESHPCLRECLAKWLITGKARYKELIEAVKGIGECAVADAIEHLSTK